MANKLEEIEILNGLLSTDPQRNKRRGEGEEEEMEQKKKKQLHIREHRKKHSSWKQKVNKRQRARN